MGSDPPVGKGNFEGEAETHLKYWSHPPCAVQKMAEPIEIPFGLWTLFGPRKHVLDGGPDLPMQRGNFEAVRAACCKVYRPSAVSWAKTAEPI